MDKESFLKGYLAATKLGRSYDLLNKWIANREYIVNAANTPLGQMQTNSYNRTFTKLGNGVAISAWTINRTINLWTGPNLFSTNPNAVRFHVNDTLSPSYSQDLEYDYTFTYLGMTWYANLHHGLNGEDLQVTNYANRPIIDVNGLSDEEAAIAVL